MPCCQASTQDLTAALLVHPQCLLFPALFLVPVVQGLAFESILSGLWQVFMWRMGSLSQFFTLEEDLKLLHKWLEVGHIVFPIMLWIAFMVLRMTHGHILDFIQPALVGLGSHSPCGRCILHGWSHCHCVD